MPNPWISHVKAYCATHDCSYKDALKKAKATYTKQIGGARRIAPTLVTQPSVPAPEFREDGGLSASHRKRKKKAGKRFLADLERKILDQEGDFGLEENLAAINLGTRCDRTPPNQHLVGTFTKPKKKKKVRRSRAKKAKKCPKPVLCPANAITVKAHCRVGKPKAKAKGKPKR
jgi:hypothetical protein